MYRYNKITRKSDLTSVEKLEGEPIEWKIERAMSNDEPITDGAPPIYTERADGVLSAYNIRTDRWEVACEGMDVVQRSIQAKRDSKPKSGDSEKGKIVEMKVDDVGGAKSTEGTGTK